MGRAYTVGVGGRRNRLHHILKVLTEVITVVVGGLGGGGGDGGDGGGVWRWLEESAGVRCESL